MLNHGIPKRWLIAFWQKATKEVLLEAGFQSVEQLDLIFEYDELYEKLISNDMMKLYKLYGTHLRFALDSLKTHLETQPMPSISSPALFEFCSTHVDVALAVLRSELGQDIEGPELTALAFIHEKFADALIQDPEFYSKLTTDEFISICKEHPQIFETLRNLEEDHPCSLSKLSKNSLARLGGSFEVAANHIFQTPSLSKKLCPDTLVKLGKLSPQKLFETLRDLKEDHPCSLSKLSKQSLARLGSSSEAAANYIFKTPSLFKKLCPDTLVKLGKSSPHIALKLLLSVEQSELTGLGHDDLSTPEFTGFSRHNLSKIAHWHLPESTTQLSQRQLALELSRKLRVRPREDETTAGPVTKRRLVLGSPSK